MLDTKGLNLDSSARFSSHNIGTGDENDNFGFILISSCHLKLDQDIFVVEQGSHQMSVGNFAALLTTLLYTFTAEQVSSQGLPE